jgi:hypothetical protein
MGKAAPRERSLKDQNRWQLWLVIAANTLFLYIVVQANAIELRGAKAVFTEAHNLVSVGFAVLITTVISNFLSADLKARVVFLRWRHALPGHRAFTIYGPRDSRVDMAALRQVHGPVLPSDPDAQNKLWYRIFQTVSNKVPILQLHRDFLLLRDYTGIAILFLFIYGACAFTFIASGKVCLIYVALLAIQFGVVRQAAFNSGTRLVTNVLAMVSTAPQRAATAD